MTASALKAAVGQVPAKREKPTTINGFLETYKSEIARALPRHMTADRMARIAITEFRKNPKLLECDPATLFGAVIQCAQLGLEPGGALGHAYLLPFNNRKRGTVDVQFIVGYRGMIDLARRSGQIISLEARVVHEADRFHVQLGLNADLQHEPAWDVADRGQLKFVYAVAKLKDGGVQFEVMSRKEIDRVRASSKSANDGPWVSHYEEMAKKTVIRRLFKYLPVSIELANAVGLDEQAEAGIAQDNGFVIDGAITEHDEPETSSDPMFDQIAHDLVTAGTRDEFDLARDLIQQVDDVAAREQLMEIAQRRAAEFQSA